MSTPCFTSRRSPLTTANTAFIQVGVAGTAATLITTVNTVVLANLKIQEKIKLYGEDNRLRRSKSVT